MAGELLRFGASAEAELRFGGGQMRAKLLRQLLELRPTAPFRQPKGLRTQLRPYQRMGVDWLRFLYENGLGGLLCDDIEASHDRALACDAEKVTGVFAAAGVQIAVLRSPQGHEIELIQLPG